MNKTTETRINDRAIMMDFCRHAGFRILEEECMQHLIKDQDKWLAAESPEKAEEIRRLAQPYWALTRIIKKVLAEGYIAQQHQATQEKEGKEPLIDFIL